MGVNAERVAIGGDGVCQQREALRTPRPRALGAKRSAQHVRPAAKGVGVRPAPQPRLHRPRARNRRVERPARAEDRAMVQQFLRRLPHGIVGARAVERGEHCLRRRPVAIGIGPIQRDQRRRRRRRLHLRNIADRLHQLVARHLHRLRITGAGPVQIDIGLGQRFLRLRFQRGDMIVDRLNLAHLIQQGAIPSFEAGNFVENLPPARVGADGDEASDGAEQRVVAQLAAHGLRASEREQLGHVALQPPDPGRHFDHQVKRQQRGIGGVVLGDAHRPFHHVERKAACDRGLLVRRRGRKQRLAVRIVLSQPIHDQHRCFCGIDFAPLQRGRRQFLPLRQTVGDMIPHRIDGERDGVPLRLRLVGAVPILQHRKAHFVDQSRRIEPVLRAPLAVTGDQRRATDERARGQPAVQCAHRRRTQRAPNSGQRFEHLVQHGGLPRFG